MTDKPDNKPIAQSEPQQPDSEQAGLSPEAAQLLMEIGQAQAFDFVKKMATVASLKIIKEIKESKSFKALVITDPSGNWRPVATFDEFCRYYMPRSRRSVDEDLQNLETFGEEFYEAGQRLGLGPRAFRQLRNLPEKKRIEIQDRVINTDDKDEVKEFLEELVEDNLKTRDALKKESQLLAQATVARENAEHDRDYFRDELRRKTSASWPEFVDEVRMESSRVAEHGMRCADDLERYIERLLKPGYGQDDDDRDRNASHSAAIHTWWLNLVALHQRVAQVVRNGYNAFEDWGLEDSTGKVLPLTDEQLHRLVVARETMLKMEEIEKLSRRRSRDAGRPRKRGRPRKA